MKQRPTDTPFLLAVCALLTFGLLIFTSAALGLLARDGATFTSVAVNQLLLGFLLGGAMMVIISRIDYRLWRPYTPYFFAFALILTLMVFVPHVGLTLKGAARWIQVGPVTFQPEEVLKLATVLFLAAVYAANMRLIHTWRKGVAPMVLIGGAAAAVLLVQPNTDGAVVIAVACAAMLFAAGGRVWHLLLLALIGVMAIGAIAYQRPYLAERFVTFYHQGQNDPHGAGWQVQQSLIAVGSGGITGRGFGQGIEKFSYLPEPIGDSIFAVAAEEFGLVGSAGLVALYVAFALLGLRIAARAPDPFGGLVALGLVVLIVGQSFVNIASVLGLIPLSGLPLIFVSHGGTALAISLCEVGVLLSISRRMKS